MAEVNLKLPEDFDSLARLYWQSQLAKARVHRRGREVVQSDFPRWKRWQQAGHRLSACEVESALRLHALLDDTRGWAL